MPRAKKPVTETALTSFLKRHPEVHCPVCGRRDFSHAPFVMGRTPTNDSPEFVFGLKTHGLVALVCRGCGHVPLFWSTEANGVLAIGPEGL